MKKGKVDYEKIVSDIILGNGKEYGLEQILNKYMSYPVPGGYYKGVIPNAAMECMINELKKYLVGKVKNIIKKEQRRTR